MNYSFQSIFLKNPSNHSFQSIFLKNPSNYSFSQFFKNKSYELFISVNFFRKKIFQIIYLFTFKLFCSTRLYCIVSTTGILNMFFDPLQAAVFIELHAAVRAEDSEWQIGRVRRWCGAFLCFDFRYFHVFFSNNSRNFRLTMLLFCPL